MPDVVYYYRMGGSTSKFMPDFLDDCIALYDFKMAKIIENALPERMKYTTSIELKNELWTWFEMYYCKYKSVFSIKQEIDRCCQIPQIVEAVNYDTVQFGIDNSGMAGFRELARKKNVDEIYNMLFRSVRKNKIKRYVKI